MSKSRASGVNSSISFPFWHRAHPSVGGAGEDASLFTKPRSPDIPSQPTHPNPIPFSTPSVPPEETQWVGQEREIDTDRGVFSLEFLRKPQFPNQLGVRPTPSDYNPTTRGTALPTSPDSPSGTARRNSRHRNPSLLLKDLPSLAFLP